METFTGAYVTATQRTAYLSMHKNMDMEGAFQHKGGGRYWMSAWYSQIAMCKAICA